MRVEGNSAWVFFFLLQKQSWIGYSRFAVHQAVWVFLHLVPFRSLLPGASISIESTLSRIFLFLELRFAGGSLSSCENTLTFRAFRHYCNTFVRPACDLNNKGPQLSYDWLFCKHPRKTPWEVLLKIKWNGTRLTQRVSMEDGSSG